ncbi:MAG: ATP-binding cassette domain-containing protein [Eubacteriales bacterium]|nr:ATP-binding cassette domain-containing protein [Eubacteriales bacterium]
MILNVSHIRKSFGEKCVLRDITFSVNTGERIAIIGPNGTGKTTLLKIIQGAIIPDGGTVHLQNGARIGVLSQYDDLSDERTIFEEVRSAKQALLDGLWTLDELARQLATVTVDHDELLRRHGNLQQELEASGAYAVDRDVRAAIFGIGFTEADLKRKVAGLSGGERARLQLVKLLLSAPDLLLLDEPTNHLDLDGVRWLEDYLSHHTKSILFISHDRYFLDRMATKVLSLNDGRSDLYTGNYSAFKRKHAQRLEAEYQAYKNAARERARQEAVIKKLKQFNREKSVRRAESRRKMLDKLAVIEDPRQRAKTVDVLITPERISGKDVLMMTDVRRMMNGRILFQDVNIHLRRGEHVALIGPNGCGKTTLLRTLLRREMPDAGEVRHGTGVTVGYYDQKQASLPENKTVLAAVHDCFPERTEGMLRNTLAAFRFFGDEVLQKIDSLSGGERARVLLCILFLRHPNFLVLDEPTNHLDIEMRESLAHLLCEYEGTVLIVSHDRGFINDVADRILSFEEMQIVSYLGDWDDYEKKRASVSNGQVHGSGGDVSDGAAAWAERKAREAARRKCGQDLKKVKESMTKAEVKMASLQRQLNDPAHAADFVKLGAWQRALEDLEFSYLDLLEKRESLEREQEAYEREED